ncbi:MAG TPA: hypothetical protein VFA21_18785, partial [Pyrinomonadaceae bacterium]|nr:hypothetical protein [Pyrinomonadaceae bacterium]
DQFLVKALETLGETDVVQKLKSAWDRGERLAELVAAEPTVLVLDGLEPLQHGPGPHDLEGRLKDPGVHALLARLATRPGKSLCIVSTRVGLKDEDLQTPSFVQESVEVLSSEAARELLRSRGVRGDEENICEAVEYLGYHPLALVLAAEYLHTFADCDVGRLHEISLLSEKTKEGRHAKSVMAAYETALRRDGDPLDLELLGVIGLFDRPTRWEWLKALAALPAIEGVTEHLAKASDRELWESINRLRQWGMLADPGSLGTPNLDAHPLVREYFGEKLRCTNESGWREAHSRMFDYLTTNTKELPDTLEEMEPLYQAVAHGCTAKRHQETLGDVYWLRIQREQEAFNTKKLGAIGAELAALTGFFNPPWERPVSALNENFKGYVLNEAGFDLRALGRLVEATQPMRVGLEFAILQESWANAAISAGNLSELHLTIGNLSQALGYARQGVELADRSDNSFQRMAVRTTLADAIYQAGDLSESETTMLEAEKMQEALQPVFPLLYSLRGFKYCTLLLRQGKYQEVQTRAIETIKIAVRNYWLLDIALDHLSLGRAYLLQAQHEDTGDFLQATDYLNQAVNGLRQAGVLEYLALGLLARAELRRVKGEFGRARADLDEAISIATRGSMGLYQADCHLEYARLYLAEGEREKAREHLRTAKGMIERMGYHLRDEEVRELERELGEAADG